MEESRACAKCGYQWALVWKGSALRDVDNKELLFPCSCPSCNGSSREVKRRAVQ